MEIIRIPFCEVEKINNFEDLLDEYGSESAIHGLPHPKAKNDSYRKLDKSGMFHVFCAFHEEKLVGFISVLLSILNHYSEAVAIVESYFVGSEYRDTGAGTALRIKAEEFSKENGAWGLLLSAPSGGVLEKVLPKTGYTQTNAVFFKGFRHA